MVDREYLKIRKTGIKKYLSPKQLKDRAMLAKIATVASAIYGLTAPNTLGLSALAMLGFGLYARRMEKKLNDSKIGTPKEGEIYFSIGKDEIGRRVDITKYYAHRHICIVGGTGMGKTSLYRVLIEQALENNFGIIYINFKAEDEDFFNLWKIAKDAGKVEDLLPLNFMPTAKPDETATFAPYMTLKTPQELADFNFNLLAPAQGEMQYWQGRGRNLMNAASRVFFWLRDVRRETGGFQLFLKAFELSVMLEVYQEMKSAIADPANPERERAEEYLPWIETYLQDLDPSGQVRQKGKAGRIDPDMQNQHGYAMQQWKEAFMDISLRYKHIFDVDKPDIDINDVLKNSRLLYIHMPALGLPNSTKEALGRLILAGLKTSTKTMLGETLLGEVGKLKQVKKTEKPKNPFLIIIDEHGTAPIPGLDDFLRQIRSLEGMAIIADQNWDTLKQQYGDGYLNTILGNTLTKIIMNIEGSSATLEYLERRLPKVKTLIPDYQYNDGFIEQGDRMTVQEEPILRKEDIMKLDRGEGYIIQGEKVVYCKFDYFEPELEDGEVIDIFTNRRDRVEYADKVKDMLENISFDPEDIEIYEVEYIPDDPYLSDTQENPQKQTANTNTNPDLDKDYEDMIGFVSISDMIQTYIFYIDDLLKEGNIKGALELYAFMQNELSQVLDDQSKIDQYLYSVAEKIFNKAKEKEPDLERLTKEFTIPAIVRDWAFRIGGGKKDEGKSGNPNN